MSVKCTSCRELVSRGIECGIRERARVCVCICVGECWVLGRGEETLLLGAVYDDIYKIEQKQCGLEATDQLLRDGGKGKEIYPCRCLLTLKGNDDRLAAVAGAATGTGSDKRSDTSNIGRVQSRVTSAPNRCK